MEYATLTASKRFIYETSGVARQTSLYPTLLNWSLSATKTNLKISYFQ